MVIHSSFFLISDNDQVGPLFIPATYVPSTQIVSPEDLDFILSQNPEDKKLQGAAIENDGEMAEKVVYDTLKEYYSQRKDAALVINNMKMFRVDAKKKGNEQEADYLTINYATQTLINIEVKRFLGSYEHKDEKDWPITKVKKQLAKIREIIGDSFQQDIKGPWRIISMVFCQEIDQDIKDCPNCHEFVAHGKAELLEKLKKLESKRKTELVGVTKNPEDFVSMCKFFLFCCPIVALPVLGNLPKVIQDAVLKSGSRENIAIFCFPTPQQRGILCHSWLIYAAPFGSGKTIFMIVKAIELAEAGEEVLFLIFAVGEDVSSDKKTLLCLDLEEKFRKHPNIKVQMVPLIDGKSDNFKGT